MQHANALDGVPRIAAVFQNDCLYLAHHMVTLGHEFRQGLPPPANQTATMIDTVPLFRELAAQRFVLQKPFYPVFFLFGGGTGAIRYIFQGSPATPIVSVTKLVFAAFFGE